MTRGLFGTSGIRGDSEKLFTNQFCFDIGRTFAKFLTQNGEEGAVATGMDPRGSSPRIKEAIEAGLTNEGREVYDQGATSVPSMCFVLLVSDYYSSSIMVSGSHIQANLNGIKFFAFNEEILKKHEKEIESIYASLKDKVIFKEGEEYEIHNENRAKDEYLEMLVKLANGSFPNWKVVVDAGDGAQSDTMPYVLKRLGINVIEQNTTIQGEFYARDTEHKPDMMGLIMTVKKEKADFGIGYDADGDRVVFVDENSEFIPGDYSATLIAKYIKGDSVVTPISTSQVVDHLEKKVYRTKVGAPYVIEKMKTTGSAIGFEPNGGCIFPEILMTRDGGSTTIKLLNILKKKNKSLSKLISELPKFYSFKDKIQYKWEQQDVILKEAKSRFKAIKIDERDGLKMWLENAPEFRIFTESDSETKAESLFQKGTSLVKDIIKRD